jgi:class 3 adenylate cyclase/pimeloyl-ACP methyl ester carboxylesterase
VERTRGYASSDGAEIAFHVTGSGPDLVTCLPYGYPAELVWDFPPAARYFTRLASFARLVLFDQRGTGASARDADAPNLEAQGRDILAVMDAAGCERATVWGSSQTGPGAIAFAHAHPERVERLVLWATTARLLPDSDYPEGYSRELGRRIMDQLVAHWGSGAMADLGHPSAANDAQARDWLARMERATGTPSTAAAIGAAFGRSDVRAQARELSMPVLVLHRTGDPIVPVAQGRWLADHIPNSRWFEAAGTDHAIIFGDWGPPVDEIEEFLTGARVARGRERILTTLLFTDIADSTARAAQLGDHAWRDLLARHDMVVRRNIAAHGGDELATTGDGFLASFAVPSAAVAAARAIAGALEPLGLTIRAGAHLTECEIAGANVAGLGVHAAARVAAAARAGEILASETVVQALLGGDAHFEDAGEHELKGVPGMWRLYRLS